MDRGQATHDRLTPAGSHRLAIIALRLTHRVRLPDGTISARGRHRGQATHDRLTPAGSHRLAIVARVANGRPRLPDAAHRAITGF